MSEPSAPVVDVRDGYCLLQLPGGGAVAALRGLTLTVAAGERVVVHGPNGSGKTTLLRVLAGEQPLSAGRAIVAGRNLAAGGARPLAELARWRCERLGWVDQEPARTLRPEFDVLDNVSLQLRLAGTPLAVARRRALEALDLLGVADLARARASTLSGGQAQRVAVAAALAHRPQLVLADEPTGQLDLASAEGVYDALAAAASSVGAALVVVSHDTRAARIADRVVRIRDGRLSETWSPNGSAAELLVVDDRGWVRLPEGLRRSAGVGSAVAARQEGRAIMLAAGGSVAESADAPDDVPPVSVLSVSPTPVRVPPEPVASLSAVTKGYPGRSVLTGFDLVVPEGRLVVVRGRSGAGKSTALRVLLGLERPDCGTVLVAGVDLAGLDRSELAALRRRIASVVGQEIHLAESSDVLANLEFACAVRGLAHDRGSSMARLEALGIAALAQRQVRLLSGGERQRVAIARALIVAPRLAVFDEPSSQLDEEAAEVLAGVLRGAASGETAIVVASHDPVLIAAADRVVDL